MNAESYTEAFPKICEIQITLKNTGCGNPRVALGELTFQTSAGRQLHRDVTDEHRGTLDGHLALDGFTMFVQIEYTQTDIGDPRKMTVDELVSGII